MKNILDYIGKEVYFLNYHGPGAIDINKLTVVSVSRFAVFDFKGKSIEIDSIFETMEEASHFLGRELKRKGL